MLKKILSTNDDIAALILRLTLGIIFFPHGAQKVFGWFGGYGFSGTMNFFTVKMGIPAIFAFLAICAEFAGSIALIVGFLTRIAAFGIGMVMIVAVLTTHLPNGFFMNWDGNQKGEGFEFHLLVIGIVIALIIRGGGTASIDKKIFRND